MVQISGKKTYPQFNQNEIDREPLLSKKIKCETERDKQEIQLSQLTKIWT